MIKFILLFSLLNQYNLQANNNTNTNINNTTISNNNTANNTISNDLICGTTSPKSLLTNNDFYLCIHFEPIKRKIIYKLKLDNFSLIHVKDSYKNLSTNNDLEITLQFQGNKIETLTLPYIKTKIYDLWSIVIGFENGNFTGITTDYGCWGCLWQDCTNVNLNFLHNKNKLKTFQSCSIPKCTPDNLKNCDLKLLIYFIGTDSNGRHLQSAGERLKNFKNYSLNTIIQKIRDYQNNFIFV